jgi:NNP family nitrate/nitrite transporter-like MFS transporter
VTAMIRDFARAGNPRTLVAAFLYFDVSFMVWVLPGVLGVFVAEDLGLTAMQKGLLAALPILSGAALRLPLGAAADRFGGRPVGQLALGVTLVTLIAGWLAADELATLYLIALLLGVAGASFAVALPMASRWYPPRYQGLALGIAGAGNSGTVLASLGAPRLAEALGWQAVFGLAALPVAAVLAAFALLAQDSPTRPRPAHAGEYLGALRQADAGWLCLFYAVTFGGFVGLASYLGIFFRDQYGLSRVAAGDLSAVCVLAGSLARPVGGVAADRVGGVRVLTAVFAAAGAAMLAVSLRPQVGLAAPAIVGGMALLGMGNGAVFQLVPQRFPRELGVVTGLVGAAGGLGGFLLPFALGALEGATGSYAPGFTLYALTALAAAGALLGVGQGWRRTWVSDAGPPGRSRWLPAPAEVER